MDARTNFTRSLSVFISGVALVIAGFLVGDARADGVTGTISDTSAGRTIQTNSGSHWAGLINLAIDGGGSVITYCIDLGTQTWPGVTYTEADWSEGSVPNLGTVTWVLRHGYPTVSTDNLLAAINLTLEPDLATLSADDAAAGTQAAVWHFTDSSNLAGSNTAGVVAVYEYLITNATSAGEPAPTLTIDPVSKAGTVGQLIGPFVVTTSAATVGLTVTGATITDAVGTPLSSVAAGGSFYIKLDVEGSATVTATATATLSSGRVFITTETSPRQKLITASTTRAITTATAEAVASIDKPVTSVTEVESEAPVTGSASNAFLATGACLMALGVITIIATRRRTA